MRGFQARRQTHIHSEQKRRANINEGFEILRESVPLPEARKAGKSKLLQLSVLHISKLQVTKNELTTQLAQMRQLKTEALFEKEDLKRKLLYAVGL